MFGEVALRSVIIVALLVLSGLGTSAVAADPAAGKSVFNSYCSLCHTVQPNRNMTGPSLFGVVGRKTGSVPGFHYSPANQAANLTWDPLPSLERSSRPSVLWTEQLQRR